MRSDSRNDVAEETNFGSSLMTAGLTCRKSSRTSCSQRELELTDSSSVSVLRVHFWLFSSGFSILTNTHTHTQLLVLGGCPCSGRRTGCIRVYIYKHILSDIDLRQISDDTCTGSDGQGRHGNGTVRSGNRRKRKSSGKDKNVRRLESNERERLRMHSINDAFQVYNLRPSFIRRRLPKAVVVTQTDGGGGASFDCVSSLPTIARFKYNRLKSILFGTSRDPFVRHERRPNTRR